MQRLVLTLLGSVPARFPLLGSAPACRSLRALPVRSLATKPPPMPPMPPRQELPATAAAREKRSASIRLTKELGAVFAGGAPSQLALDALLREKLALMDLRHLTMLLHRAFKHKQIVLPLSDFARCIIALPDTDMDAQGVGNALYGLQKYSSDAPEVRALLAALAPKVERCPEALSALNVGNALNGLKGCSSDAPEVRAVLAALAPKVES